ncbi:uncharacterized protein CIMG_01914 [Coccidioides immitis RS]|uniref:Uncharacterized protein n=2 Tax=Coccidioides immitis TaxID=5501 RepID=J3KK80_COCIM|nr:uncharacterized protein CIMG_01914 [Coccidioides immitis RS]EAS36560.3 hypothetical protein CIMG_01914 [Coccidioides immitis RS]
MKWTCNVSFLIARSWHGEFLSTPQPEDGPFASPFCFKASSSNSSSLNSQGLNRGVVDPCQQSVESLPGRDSKSIVIKHLTRRPVESILVGAEKVSVSRDSGFYVTEAVRRYPWGDLIFGTKVEIGPLDQPRLRGASFRSRLCPAYNASTNTSIEISNQSGEPSNHMESHWITILFLPPLGGRGRRDERCRDTH